MLTCIFIAYFVYLCIQVCIGSKSLEDRGMICNLFYGLQLYEDQPLIKLLAVNITESHPSPDVEMCSANSNIRIWYCDIVKMEWVLDKYVGNVGSTTNLSTIVAGQLSAGRTALVWWRRAYISLRCSVRYTSRMVRSSLESMQWKHLHLYAEWTFIGRSIIWQLPFHKLLPYPP